MKDFKPNIPPFAEFEFENEDLEIDHDVIPNDGTTRVVLNGCNVSGDDNYDAITYQWFIGDEAIDGAIECHYTTSELSETSATGDSLILFIVIVTSAVLDEPYTSITVKAYFTSTLGLI